MLKIIDQCYTFCIVIETIQIHGGVCFYCNYMVKTMSNRSCTGNPAIYLVVYIIVPSH